MKTVRILRNIALLFILAVALLDSQEGMPLFHANHDVKQCGVKVGYNGCTFNKGGGGCKDTVCGPGQNCAETGCVIFSPFGNRH